MLSVGIATGLIILSVMILAEGEVVRLVTHDSVGQPLDTELWIADLPDGTYLRAGSPSVKWLARLRTDPNASLERDGKSVSIETFTVEDPTIRTEVNRAMAEKYGAADRVWDFFRSDDSVVLRVQPLGATAVIAEKPHGAPPSPHAHP